MDVPRNDDDKSTDGEEKKIAVEGEATTIEGEATTIEGEATTIEGEATNIEGVATAVDDDLTLDLQSLALTTPEQNEENRTMSDGMRGLPMRGRPMRGGMRGRPMRGRPILGRHSKESAIPSVPSFPLKAVSPPVRKYRRQLDFSDVPCMSELSTGLGKQPENPCEETNQSMMGSSACAPQHESTSSSSEVQSTRNSLPDSINQQSTQSTPKDTPKERRPLSSPEDDPKQRWTQNSSEDAPKQQQSSPSSLADTIKRRWTRSSLEEAAELHSKLPCNAPAPSPSKGAPEQSRSAALDAMQNLWGSSDSKNIRLSPPKSQTKRNIETSACGSECGALSPNAKRHRTDVIQPMGQLSQRMDDQGSNAGQCSSDQPRRLGKRKNSSELETEAEEKKSKEEEDKSG